MPAAGHERHGDAHMNATRSSVRQRARRVSSTRGQALVEFSLAFVILALILFGIVDFGRAIYQFNAVSQAAREIARVTSVHPGTDFTTAGGRSPETNAVINVQKNLVPGLVVADDAIDCVDANGTVQLTCDFSKDSVRVIVTASFTALTPPMNAWSAWDMKGSSSVQIQ
jgi:Flp pilus assembly protein TadG